MILPLLPYSSRATVALALLLAGFGVSQGRAAEAAQVSEASEAAESDFPPASLPVYLLDVILNGAALDKVIVVYRDSLDIYLPVDFLHRHQIRTPGQPRLIRGEVFMAANTLTGLRVVMREQDGTIELNCAAHCFDGTEIAARQPQSVAQDNSSFGGFFNYDVNADFGDFGDFTGLLGEGGVFTPLGVLSGTFTCASNRPSSACVRIETSLVIDRPQQRRRLILGDSTTQARSLGSPVRFAGLTWGTDFGLDPGFITFPTPDFQGSATLPSTADVYINSVRRFASGVPAGPFTITDLPIVTGGGEATLVVTDLLGRETQISTNYYASPRQLKPGLSDYSVEIGSLRRNFGSRSQDYGQAFAAGRYRRGWSDSLTTGAFAELGTDQQLAGLSMTLVHPQFGAVEMGAAVSQAEGLSGTGGLFSLVHEYRAQRWSTGFEASHATRDFRRLGEAERESVPGTTLRSRVSYSHARFGTVSANLLYRGNRDEADDLSAGLLHSVTLGQVAFNIGLLRVFKPQETTVFSLRLSLPFGRDRHASVGLSHDEDGLSADSRISRTAPREGGFGYHLRADERGDGRYEAGVEHRSRFGVAAVQANRFGGREAVRLNARGGFAVLGSDVIPARQITESFALVTTGEEEGVRVLLDRRPIGRTDRKGRVLISELRAFDENRIAFDPRDLPLSADFETTEVTLTPGRRSGHRVDFDIRNTTRFVANISDEQGQPLPVGTRLSRSGSEIEVIVGSDGRVFLENVDLPITLIHRGADGACAVEVEERPQVRGDTRPWNNLGTLPCRPL